MMLEMDESILRTSARCPADAGRYLSFPAAMRSPSAPIFIIFPNLANIHTARVQGVIDIASDFLRISCRMLPQQIRDSYSRQDARRRRKHHRVQEPVRTYTVPARNVKIGFRLRSILEFYRASEDCKESLKSLLSVQNKHLLVPTLLW
jgi:hypothetical protein